MDSLREKIRQAIENAVAKTLTGSWSIEVQGEGEFEFSWNGKVATVSVYATDEELAAGAEEKQVLQFALEVRKVAN